MYSFNNAAKKFKVVFGVAIVLAQCFGQLGPLPVNSSYIRSGTVTIGVVGDVFGSVMFQSGSTNSTAMIQAISRYDLLP